MRDLSTEELTHLQARSGLRARLLVWITAPPILEGGALGTPESLGLWNGDDARVIEVGGVERSYVGLGALIDIEPITAGIGTDVRTIQARLAAASPAVVAAVRGYDLRLAPVEIHRLLTDPLTHIAIAPPRRLFKGWIDQIEFPTGTADEEAVVTATLASAALALTRSLASRYSDGAMRRRGDDDRLWRHADVSGSVPVYWGEKRVSPTPATANPLSGIWGGINGDR